MVDHVPYIRAIGDAGSAYIKSLGLNGDAALPATFRYHELWDAMNAAVANRHPEHQYLDLLRKCLDQGVYREGRNGGTYGLFGEQIRFDLSKGFPLLTTKRLNWKAIAVELLWFLRGDTNVKFLHDHGVHIWDEWADPVTGELGPVYGKQWRSWEGSARFVEGRDFATGKPTPEWQPSVIVDQVAKVIEGLKKDPNGRRHIVTAWNPAEIDDMALPPCHCMFQFFVANGKLSCQLYQRSGDVFLGVPFNIASYALLTHLVAREVGLQVGDFVHSFGDVHLYENHVEQAREQLQREPRPFPKLDLSNWTPDFPSLERLMVGDAIDVEALVLAVFAYNPHPAIRAEVSA